MNQNSEAQDDLSIPDLMEQDEFGSWIAAEDNVQIAPEVTEDSIVSMIIIDDLFIKNK
jgi:hypothetical protein